MVRLTRAVKTAMGAGDATMGKQWPVWVLALFVYAMAGFVIMTRIRIPTGLHLIVFIMAATVLSVTSIRIEWGALALALILPFARPGISVGSLRLFQISGFNFALVGVWMAYVLRYLADTVFAQRGPFIQRTLLDKTLIPLGLIVIISSLWSLNLNSNLFIRTMTALYTKELIMYLLWFYLIVALIRTPEDLRRFVIAFAIGGLASSTFGVIDRVVGGATEVTQGMMEEELAAGAGGRMRGGWLGVPHPNMFAAILLMTVPFWFFAVGHIRGAVRKFIAEAAVVTGFMGFLYTYSRSAWSGAVVGLGLVGLADRKALARIVVFVLIFAIVAQTVMLFTYNMNVIDVVSSRFEQLEKSDYSGRPAIYRANFAVIRKYPLLGVGMGAFRAHAPADAGGWAPTNTHNAYLSFAAESGVGAGLAFALAMFILIRTAFRNLRSGGRTPGYGFIALGSCGALLGLSAQMLVVNIFQHRLVGYAFYALAAVIVVFDRMVKEGAFDAAGVRAAEPGRRSIWIG